MLRFLVGLWLAVLVAMPAHAQTIPARPSGPILDEAGLLTPAQTVDLTGKLTAFNDRSNRTLVVATVKSLGGKEIQPYSVDLFRAWGIGDAKKNNGVLLLVAPVERKVWITTGYAADDYLTDAMSGIIIRQDILPKFKVGDMGGGIVAGVDAIIRQLELPPEQAARRADEASRQANKKSVSEFSALPIVFFMIVLFMILNGFRRGGGGRRYRSSRGGIDPWVVLWGIDAISRASRGRGGWAGSGGWGGSGGFGGGGGGFGGFGGGSTGGGGAGGSW